MKFPWFGIRQEAGALTSGSSLRAKKGKVGLIFSNNDVTTTNKRAGEQEERERERERERDKDSARGRV